MSTTAESPSQAPNQSTELETYRARRDAIADHIRRLRKQSADLATAISAVGTASRAGQVALEEKRAIDATLKLREQELADAELIVSKRETKEARVEFDHNCAEMIRLRYEITELMHEASDLFGQLITLQQATPAIANKAQMILTRDPHNILAQLAAPLNLWACSWMDGRTELSIPYNHEHPRLRPTQKKTL